MTKNGRRALFLLVATVANMLLTVVILVALVLLWSLLSAWLKISSSAFIPATLVAFLAAVVGAGVVYGKFLKAIQKRPELSERFGLVKQGKVP
jgi:hypothetical protein